MLIALAESNLITINAAIPILLGDNIGTCITALLASIGTSVSARRTAVAHAAFNIVGTCIIVMLLSPYTRVIVFLTKGNIPRQIANAHTLFNVMNTIILLPLIPYFVKAITFIIPGKEPECELASYYLDKRLIKTPVIALEQVKKEILRMAKTAESMIHESIDALFTKDGNKLRDKFGSLMNHTREEDKCSDDNLCQHLYCIIFLEQRFHGQYSDYNLSPRVEYKEALIALSSDQILLDRYVGSPDQVSTCFHSEQIYNRVEHQVQNFLICTKNLSGLNVSLARRLYSSH